MLIPEFMQFYKYTVTQVLDEYARTFYSLVNAMYRIKASQSITEIGNVASAMSGKDGQDYVESLRKQEKGIHGILKEVRIAKKAKRNG
jgi:hypothetical protein